MIVNEISLVIENRIPEKEILNNHMAANTNEN